MSYELLADAVSGLVASNTSLKDAASEVLTRSNAVLDETQLARDAVAVSYTHLTLPTSDLV